ncbi:hypothetical protein [Amphritea balenae]|uniref:Uncharacterized protein n=1 Tax=Amphritea balenae TaxID=452629 RepID=A0A3P1SMD8_9GAMM|nr:hypothetical protein [Amphritea balenae]RRC98277.1 hypothetical protein EHS89_14390 [Amphritea balenae]GGK80613.1 hypothetical protein GCM10007941_33730 [Amphritea balenae]
MAIWCVYKCGENPVGSPNPLYGACQTDYHLLREWHSDPGFHILESGFKTADECDNYMEKHGLLDVYSSEGIAWQKQNGLL